MPIQIRELIVTATVDDQQLSSAKPTSAAGPVAQDKLMREQLVQACVDEVMRVLKQQGRR
jgi:hypothetical protein